MVQVQGIPSNDFRDVMVGLSLSASAPKATQPVSDQVGIAMLRSGVHAPNCRMGFAMWSCAMAILRLRTRPTVSCRLLAMICLLSKFVPAVGKGVVLVRHDFALCWFPVMISAQCTFGV